MDILKKIKEIDLAARCNNRVFYENVICLIEQSFSEDDDCKICKHIKELESDLKASLHNNFNCNNTIAYYPFRLNLLFHLDKISDSEITMISEQEYANDIYYLDVNKYLDKELIEDIVKSIYNGKSNKCKEYLKDRCLELWNNKMKVQLNENSRVN